MYSASSLRDWKGPVSPAETIFRVLSVASATNAAPPAHASLRRSARREALAVVTDTAELTEIAELAMAENETLAEQLKESEYRTEIAFLERDEAIRELDELRETKRLADRVMAEAMAQVGRQDPGEVEAVEAPAPKTVLEAVQLTEPQCPHLSFAERAFTSAEGCPYEFLEDLLKLERVAALWARKEGIGGMDLGAKATELGLHWKPDVSGTTTGGTKARQYEFMWRGERRRVGPHTRRDRGNGAGRIARVYLWKYEPDDPTERLLVVGVCGPKLEDSTTG